MKSSDEKSSLNGELRRRPVAFQYPELPRFEILFYFLVIIIGTAYAWWRVYQTSIGYTDAQGYVQASDWALVGGNRDYNNWEWERYKPFVYRALPWLIGHSILYSSTESFLGSFWSPFMLTYWITATCCIASVQIVLLCVAEAAVVYFASRLGPHWTMVWISGITCLWINMHHRHEIFGDLNVDNGLLEIALITYKIVQYISFCLTHLESPRTKNKPLLRGFYNLLWYSFYLPYFISIIRIYRKFAYEMDTRPHRKNSLMTTAFFALRIVFWFYFADFIRNFLYFDSIILEIPTLRKVSLDTLVSIGFVTGTWFYLKYHVIFGFLSIFARLDNMAPPDPPSCICRISVYSNLWRNFDRGIYDFFKEHIFLPICRPTFSVPRKMFGLTLSYGFLLTWHGWEHMYLVWVALNIVPLVMEQVLRAAYIGWWHPYRERHLSDTAFRRLIATVQMCPLAFGTYATFYFISSSEAGWVFVDRIFWGETVTFHMPFLNLLLYGYCFCQCCIQCEMMEDSRVEKKRKTEQAVLVSLQKAEKEE